MTSHNFRTAVTDVLQDGGSMCCWMLRMSIPCCGIMFWEIAQDTTEPELSLLGRIHSLLKAQ